MTVRDRCGIGFEEHIVWSFCFFNQKLVIIGWGNGLSLNKQQAITLTNDDFDMMWTLIDNYKIEANDWSSFQLVVIRNIICKIINTSWFFTIDYKFFLDGMDKLSVSVISLICWCGPML